MRSKRQGNILTYQEMKIDYTRKLWAIVPPSGVPRIFTIHYRKQQSIRLHCEWYSGNSGNWNDWYKKGYRCVQMDVNFYHRFK